MRTLLILALLSLGGCLSTGGALTVDIPQAGGPCRVFVSGQNVDFEGKVNCRESQRADGGFPPVGTTLPSPATPVIAPPQR